MEKLGKGEFYKNVSMRSNGSNIPIEVTASVYTDKKPKGASVYSDSFSSYIRDEKHLFSLEKIDEAVLKFQEMLKSVKASPNQDVTTISV